MGKRILLWKVENSNPTHQNKKINVIKKLFYVVFENNKETIQYFIST